MSVHRRWTYELDRRSGPREASVEIDGDFVRSSQPDRSPDPQRRPLAECFEQGACFDARDPAVRAELVAELARRIDPSQLAQPIDRERLLYARAFDGASVESERFAYVLSREDGSVREAFGWLVNGSGVHVRNTFNGEVTHVLADECFVSGPPTHSAPVWHRAQLRAKLRLAQRSEGALEIDRAAPLVRYDAIERRDWAWDRNSDGESFAGTAKGCVVAGYQYQHDYGLSYLPPENVLRPAWRTRISLHVPSDVLGEIRALLEAAGTESLVWSTVAASDAVALHRALAPRADFGAKWPQAATLEFDRFGDVRKEKQWQGSAAFGLFASLCPGRSLSQGCVVSDEHRLYRFGSDSIWVSSDGAAIIRASHCFGAWAGGVDDWWHIAPSPRARVAFAIGTDYSQDTLRVVLGADDDVELAKLRAHCEAYFAMLGLVEKPR